MTEFKEQLDKDEKEKVEKLMTELRELAAKGQAGDASTSAETIREKIHETQQASLGLFKKVSYIFYSPHGAVANGCCILGLREALGGELGIRGGRDQGGEEGLSAYFPSRPAFQSCRVSYSRRSSLASHGPSPSARGRPLVWRIDGQKYASPTPTLFVASSTPRSPACSVVYNVFVYAMVPSAGCIVYNA
jgi:hypothetical protein